MINKDSVICINKDIDATEFNDEKVMMNMDKGKYYALNEVGSRIWDLINKNTDVSEIIKALLEEYDVSEEECTKEVISYLEDLYNAELIEVSK